MFKPDKLILTAGPSVTDLELKYTSDAVKNGWNENWNGYLNQFESKFANIIGAKYAVSTSSGTGALHLSLLALGIGVGDEVIIPDLTWVATAHAIKYTGANPVFVDVDPETWTIDPDKIIPAINKRTKAIMPVHLYGHPCNMESIMSIANEFNLYVVEDAAPAVGAMSGNKYVGSFGEFGVFSFQGAKMVVTGEGGMIVSNDKSLIEVVRRIGDHGRAPKEGNPFWIDCIGFKYKMSNLQAAFGLAQIERLDELIMKKRTIFEWYKDRLKNIDGLQLNTEADWAKSIYWMPSICLNGDFPITRDQLANALKGDLIDTRPVFPKVSAMKMWNDQDNPIATNISNNALNLPGGHNLREEIVDYICRSIKHHLNS
jgi:perosamine synthetase